MSEQEHETQFTRGYNNGYLLSRYEPETLKTLLAQDDQKSPSPYRDGIEAGQLACQQQMFQEHLQRARKINNRSGPKIR